MTTIVTQNGSEWAGQEPDNLETLFDVLKSNALRRDWEFADMPADHAFIDRQWIGVNGDSHDLQTGETIYYASESQPYKGLTMFHGNFADLSHGFCVYTDDTELIGRLTHAIRANMRRKSYTQQPRPTRKMGRHSIIFPDGSRLTWKRNRFLPE